MDNPDFLLASNDGIYPTANISCCFRVNEVDKLEHAIQYLNKNTPLLRLSFMSYQICSLGLC